MRRSHSMISSPAHSIVIGRRNGADAIGATLFEGMCRMRCRVFKERLDWETPTDGALELDEFDDEDALYVLIVNNETQVVEGGVRVRPTTKPNMLANTFPYLMQGLPIPADIRTMEVSRLALMNPKRFQSSATSFADMTNELLHHLISASAELGAKRFVWVTSAPIERLMRKSLLGMRRISPTMRIGNVLCVADEMPVNQQAASHCLALIQAQEAIAA